MDDIKQYFEKIEDKAICDTLRRVRTVAKEVCPDAEDAISYGMPGLKYKGRYLMAYAAFKDHMSVFPGAGPIAELKQDLKGYVVSKGTVQFTLDNPLSDDLLRRLVAISKDIVEQWTTTK